MHAAIASITERRDAHAAHRDGLRAELRTIQKQVAQRQAAQQAYAREIDAQARRNGPELAFWETYLALRIEGAGQADRLKFVFECVDEREWQRQAWFELDTSGGKEYAVVAARPKVEDGGLERCVVKLNENGDLGAFLKGMRALFVRAMK